MALLAMVRAFQPAPLIMGAVVVLAQMCHEALDIWTSRCIMLVYSGLEADRWRGYTFQRLRTFIGGSRSRRRHCSWGCTSSGISPVLFPFRMIRKIRLPVHVLAVRLLCCPYCDTRAARSRLSGYLRLRPYDTSWSKQPASWVSIALGDLGSPCIQAWFFALRTLARLPSRTTNIAELRAAKTPGQRQHLFWVLE